MDAVVRDYDDADPEGVRRVGDPIDGTAFFPGGHGLWRGLEPHGPVPMLFPEECVLFVGHNFDKVAGYERSLQRGIEVVNGPTWRNLREYIAHAGLRPEQCFFTNALMGLQPEKARGRLKTTERFRAECSAFLKDQIDLVRPRAVVALGPVAQKYVADIATTAPMLGLMHPYAAIRRADFTRLEGRRLKDFLSGANGRVDVARS
ncbi:MAG TPA: uracil-DNA glycosylase family protein [Candidatus Elarobacter sp.]|jgi:uracil-DNA glycosylase family 4|nr:uracil-DNA glycosylase family protein [Candidatus Elarobacter sp.]